MASGFPNKISNLTMSVSNEKMSLSPVKEFCKTSEVDLLHLFSFHYSESTQLCSLTLSDVKWSYGTSLTLLPNL